MQNELYSIYHLTLDPTKFPAFKTLIEKIVAATSKEDNTLTYKSDQIIYRTSSMR